MWRLLSSAVPLLLLLNVATGCSPLLAPSARSGAGNPIAWDGRLDGDPNRSASEESSGRRRSKPAQQDNEDIRFARRLVICQGCGDIQPEAGAKASKELFENPDVRNSVYYRLFLRDRANTDLAAASVSKVANPEHGSARE